MPDAFTPADADRLGELSDLHELEERDLTPAECAEWTALVERWQHAEYLRMLALAPSDWQPPMPGGPEDQATLAASGLSETEQAAILRRIRDEAQSE